ncbi:mannose-6-phosphate isomerase 1 [Rhodamnia argentea]|uniref:Mannose-6-phosphate isomerase n=1 Tax=Rhodamnia argentea TaxID=178133 RepID=A0A8B8NMG2_9MYRT|nr:mannose-6-phosphate isomerase 1 [Rhodamnia argentea]
MESQSPKLKRLRCSVQNSDWGRRGEESQVAKLFALNSGSEADVEMPYAEFWMGTHGSGPSFLLPTGCDNGGSKTSRDVTLKAWISSNPDVLGDKVVAKWGCDLPFLFKVLSIAKALSIQAHPDKESARALHKAHPNVYKDANHKPEMALAITKFEAICGFISTEELKQVLCDVPEIVELVGSTEVEIFIRLGDQEEEKVKSHLQLIFTKLMSASADVVALAVSHIKSRLELESQARPLTDKEQLVLRLEKQYPADVGVISAFFFNYVRLDPGEALYLGPNEPHAYVSGECIECMATSDNVVRAGLTPKSRDIQTLCSMLTYKQGFPDILKGEPLNAYITRYIPPFDEFEVDRCVLPKGTSTVFSAVLGPSIFLVTNGTATINMGCMEQDVVAEGDVLFVPANVEIHVTSVTELQVYRAGVNSRFLKSCELENGTKSQI